MAVETVAADEVAGEGATTKPGGRASGHHALRASVITSHADLVALFQYRIVLRALACSHAILLLET